MCVPHLLATATIRGQCLFEGGIYSKTVIIEFAEWSTPALLGGLGLGHATTVFTQPALGGFTIQASICTSVCTL